VKLAIRIAAAMSALVWVAAPAGAKALRGRFTVHYFSGPTHAETSTMCVSFSQTGDIAGFPDSGTWKVKKFGSGNFVVDGNVIRFYGTYDKGLKEINHQLDATSMTGSYDVWNVSAFPVTAIDDGTIQVQAGCQ
jgi:hypothetical protein